MTTFIRRALAAALIAAAAMSPARAEPTEVEVQVLILVNERRAAGAVCPGGQRFGPAPELLPSFALFDVAQRWSRAQLQRDTMSHGDFAGRIRAACANPGAIAENVAGNRSATAVVQAWMESDGHCRNIMNPAFTRAGVGHAAGGRYGGYWTLKFASNFDCH